MHWIARKRKRFPLPVQTWTVKGMEALNQGSIRRRMSPVNRRYHRYVSGFQMSRTLDLC